MTERDWLSLTGPEDLYGELAAVVQPRKLFQLGAAFLTRVREHIREQAILAAVDATRRYVAGTAGPRDVLACWATAEEATGLGVWGGAHSPNDHDYEYPCSSCERRRQREFAVRDAVDIHHRVREGIRDPGWFAAQAAWLALEYTAENASAKERARIRQEERLAQWRLFIDFIGDPLAPPHPCPVKLAHHPAIGRLLKILNGEDRLDPLTLLALADAIEEAGCTEQPLLAHLREQGPHFVGCWAVERVAGRELLELPVDEEIIYPLEEDSRPSWWWGA
jgi:hypothetical protein